MITEGIQKIIDLIDHAISDEIALGDNSWYVLKPDYDEEIDRLRWMIENSRVWLDNYREWLIEETGISTLKIKYTWASGYFIEIPKSQISKIWDSFTHKQTLVNASRYITHELLDFESDIVMAEQNMLQREAEILEWLRQEVLVYWTEIRHLTSQVWELDLVWSLAQVAYTHWYSCPKITHDYKMEITSGRHAVIETMGNDFISNDLYLDKKIFSHLITWPNMWWKSTFLRQNVLIILLAHIGSFVPAKKAIIPMTDKIFSRIWASDNLYLGQSTFMVEMQEIAYILNNATANSFVIIDEVWRGTSTYDGMSLAWSILQENHNYIQAKTLFSTHYHELCEEAKTLSWVKNFSVAVWENDENIIFLRKIIPWAIYKSYGIEVAKLAGINKRVLAESRKMLEKLRSQDTSQLSLSIPEIAPEKKVKDPIIASLEWLDLNSLTPMDALVKLHELQSRL